jgi:hypothetical protein
VLVYGGPLLEADARCGFVAGKPSEDHSILMRYTNDEEPPPFPEEKNYLKLFERRSEKDTD